MAADLVVVESSRADHSAVFEARLRARGLAVMTGRLQSGNLLSLAARLGASAVVYDGFPSNGDLRAISDAVRQHPQLGILVVGPVEPRLDVLVALSCGVSGYADESTGPGAAVDAVDTVRRGELCLPPGVSRPLLEHLRSGGRGIVVPRPGGGVAQLTGREWEVLVLLRQGRSTGEIADRLVVAAVTVRSHVSAVLHKLGLATRADLTSREPAAAGGTAVAG
jgi:DNA-binding NarL/FixJ family response regulator